MLDRDLSFDSLHQNLNSVTTQALPLFKVDASTFTNWKWQMSHQLHTSQDLESFFSLSKSDAATQDHLKQLFRVGITPYYATLALQHSNIRLQALPSFQEILDPEGASDPLNEKDHSPVKEVVHVYPDRVAFCVAMLCPVYCRYCYRKRRDQEEGLHYNRDIIEKGLAYIASQTSIKDVLITGGDPFIAHDQTIEHLLQRLREIPHVDIIRFGTRTPVTLPYRITESFAKMLSRYHPIWINTHFNCKEELTPDATLSLKYLADAGIPIGNQSVLLKGINDTPEAMMALCRELVKHRVRPYYLFHAHLVAGTKHLRVPIQTGLDIIKSLRGRLSGYAIPTFIVDTPSGKIPLYPHHFVMESGDDVILSDLHGEIWREAFAGKSAHPPTLQ